MPSSTARLVVAGLVLLLACGAAMAGSVVDTFGDGAPSRWRFFADTVMGGKSTGKASFQTVDGVAFARLSGNVTTANNGGFIQIRTDLRSALPEDTTGIVVKVRGNDQRYFVHLRTNTMVFPWQYYQASFTVTRSWKEIRLPLSAFKPSDASLRAVPVPGSIKSVGIVAYGRDHQAEIDVREVGTY
jgi:hypothetical protein